MGAIEFASPQWIPYVLAGVSAMLAIGLVWLHRRARILWFYGRGGGRIHGQFRASLFVALLSLVGLGLGLLLCEPYERKQVAHDVYEPVHIVIALDVSKSMLASTASNQCSPSRLALAVLELTNLTEFIESEGLDKIALVVFSRYAYLPIPVPTDDFHLFRQRLEKETLNENVLSMPEGTNQWRAVKEAVRIFDSEKSYRKMLIILTDGEPDGPEGTIVRSMEEAVDPLHRTDIDDIYVVGVGEPGVRQMVPLGRVANGCPDEAEGFMVQTEGAEEGKVMTTATNTAALKELAKKLGAEYFHAATGSDLVGKIKGILEGKRAKLGTRYETANFDLSGYIIKALLVMMAALAMLKTP